jgi:hypothetical protein
MSSRSYLKCKRTADEIESLGSPMSFPYEYCFRNNHPCFFMESKSVKCSTCARLGRKCINTSWASLDRTYQKKKEALDKDLVELVILSARIVRNQKILKLAEERAKQKTICLMDELEAEEEEEHQTGPDGKSNTKRESDLADLQSALLEASSRSFRSP